MRFTIIVAMDKKQGISKDRRMPWHLPSEIKHFKNVTTHSKTQGKINAVVMGRRTWESLPPKYRPLSDRLNVVITRKPQIDVPDSVLVYHSFESALDHLRIQSEALNLDQVFVIGGGKIYEQALMDSLCDRIIVTHIMHDFECDLTLSNFSTRFEEIDRQPIQIENGFAWYVATYRPLSNPLL